MNIKKSLFGVLLILLVSSCNQAQNIQSFQFKDELLTVNRTFKKGENNKLYCQLIITGLKNNCSECPFFMTDTLSPGVKTLQDTNCSYKVKLPRDNEVGFTLLPRIPDTISLSYFIDLNNLKEIFVDGDVAYHPKRVMTLLQTDCKIK